MTLHNTNMMWKALNNPFIKSITKINFFIESYQTIVTQKMTFWGNSFTYSLRKYQFMNEKPFMSYTFQYNQVVFVVHHPESKDCHFETYFDGSINDTWFAIIEVSTDARSKRCPNWFTHLEKKRFSNIGKCQGRVGSAIYGLGLNLENLP